MDFKWINIIFTGSFQVFQTANTLINLAEEFPVRIHLQSEKPVVGILDSKI